MAVASITITEAFIIIGTTGITITVGAGGGGEEAGLTRKFELDQLNTLNT